jgi:hypothetical protein
VLRGSHGGLGGTEVAAVPVASEESVGREYADRGLSMRQGLQPVNPHRRGGAAGPVLSLTAQSARPPGRHRQDHPRGLANRAGGGHQQAKSVGRSRAERGRVLDLAVQEALALRQGFFPESAEVDPELLAPLLARGEELLNSSLTEGDALEWASGFVFPTGPLEADERLFLRFGGDVPSMARHRLQELYSARMNRSRIDTWVSRDNPERGRLVDLAEEGMPVLVAGGFVPNSKLGVIPALRPAYRRLAPVVNRLLFEGFHSRGLAFIVSKEAALTVPGLHLNVNSWVPKAGKVQGRPIGDCSDGGRGADSVNSDEAKLACDARWGVIHHPSLSDLVVQVVECLREEQVKDATVTWADLVMFKVDLSGAFTLLSFCPEDVPLMAFELTDDRVIFFLCGLFGWTGTPACFDVVSRALRHELKHLVRGKASMYVDDIMGVCLLRFVAENIDRVVKFCNGLLGPLAVAAEKTEQGRRLDHIGYVFDLDTMLVGISGRNVAKSLVGYLEAVPAGRTHVREMQRLASWASRYAQICPFMRPFLRDLYAAYTGRKPGMFFQLDGRAQRAVRLLRLLIVMSASEPGKFTRTMLSFVPPAAALVIEFDASLQGIGVVWYHIGMQGAESPIGALSGDIRQLGFGDDSSHQNTAEFIAATVGVLGAIALGFHGASVILRGDSTSALCWGFRQRFKGILTVNAVVVFTMLLVQSGVTVVDAQFLTSQENVVCDTLSRGTSVEVAVRTGVLPPGVAKIDTVERVLAQVLEDCSPRLDTSTDAAFEQLWRRSAVLSRSVQCSEVLREN